MGGAATYWKASLMLCLDHSGMDKKVNKTITLYLNKVKWYPQGITRPKSGVIENGVSLVEERTIDIML
jgi:hypothetical protein